VKHTPHLDKVLLAIGAVDRPFGHGGAPGVPGMVRGYRRFERGREELVSGYAGRMRHESARSYADVIANSPEGRLGRYGDYNKVFEEAHAAHDSPEKLKGFLQKYKLRVPPMDDRFKELHGMPAAERGTKEASPREKVMQGTKNPGRMAARPYGPGYRAEAEDRAVRAARAPQGSRWARIGGAAHETKGGGWQRIGSQAREVRARRA
jgi:hypothetical protein